MANRIVGNTYILDTGSANTPLPWNHGKIMAAAAWFSGPTGLAIFSGANTTDVVIRLAATLSTGASTDKIFFGGVDFQEMKLPTLTAGTAWLYFG